MTVFVPPLHTVPRSTGNVVYEFVNWFIHSIVQQGGESSVFGCLSLEFLNGRRLQEFGEHEQSGRGHCLADHLGGGLATHSLRQRTPLLHCTATAATGHARARHRPPIRCPGGARTSRSSASLGISSRGVLT